MKWQELDCVILYWQCNDRLSFFPNGISWMRYKNTRVRYSRFLLILTKNILRNNNFTEIEINHSFIQLQ